MTIDQVLKGGAGTSSCWNEKVDEPQLRALFETSAEVLGGLRKAFQDYERMNEAA
jgi:hypothetical protein